MAKLYSDCPDSRANEAKRVRMRMVAQMPMTAASEGSRSAGLAAVFVAVLVAFSFLLIAPVVDQHAFERVPHSHADARDDVRYHLHAYQALLNGIVVIEEEYLGVPVGEALSPLHSVYAALALVVLASTAVLPLAPFGRAPLLLSGAPAQGLTRPLFLTRLDRPPLS